MINIKKIICVFAFFLLNIGVVFADLFGDCTSDNNCIPLCVYDYPNSVKDYKSQESAFVGFYYENYMYNNSTQIDNPIDYKKVWEIAAFTNLGDFYARVRGQRYGYSGDVLPIENIMWSNVNGGSGYQFWNDKLGYIKLSQHFDCPQYFYSRSPKELNTAYFCFANETEECEKQSLMDGSYNYPLIYDFSEEFATILDYTYYNHLYSSDIKSCSSYQECKFISEHEYADFPLESDLEVLSLHDSNIKYNSNLNFTDNLKNNGICEYLSSQSTESYSSKLQSAIVNDGYAYGQKIADKLSFVANKVGVRAGTEGVYKNYSTILNIVLLKRSTTIESDGRNFSTHYNSFDAYQDRLLQMTQLPLKKALDNVKKECSVISSENKIDIDTEVVSENVIKEVEITFRPVSEVDLGTNFDCGTFFSEGLAKLISNAYFVIEIGALIIFVALSTLEYAKVILNGDQDGMKKANKALVIRLVIVVVIFLLPALINFMLGIFNIEGFNSDHPLCVQIKNK